MFHSAKDPLPRRSTLTISRDNEPIILLVISMSPSLSTCMLNPAKVLLAFSHSWRPWRDKTYEDKLFCQSLSLGQKTKKCIYKVDQSLNWENTRAFSLGGKISKILPKLVPRLFPLPRGHVGANKNKRARSWSLRSIFFICQVQRGRLFFHQNKRTCIFILFVTTSTLGANLVPSAIRAGCHVPRPIQGLSLGRGESLGTRVDLPLVYLLVVYQKKFQASNAAFSVWHSNIVVKFTLITILYMLHSVCWCARKF